MHNKTKEPKRSVTCRSYLPKRWPSSFSARAFSVLLRHGNEFQVQIAFDPVQKRVSRQRRPVSSECRCRRVSGGRRCPERLQPGGRPRPVRRRRPSAAVAGRTTEELAWPRPQHSRILRQPETAPRIAVPVDTADRWTVRQLQLEFGRNDDALFVSVAAAAAAKRLPSHPTLAASIYIFSLLFTYKKVVS